MTASTVDARADFSRKELLEIKDALECLGQQTGGKGDPPEDFDRLQAKVDAAIRNSGEPAAPTTTPYEAYQETDADTAYGEIWDALRNRHPDSTALLLDLDTAVGDRLSETRRSAEKAARGEADQLTIEVAELRELVEERLVNLQHEVDTLKSGG